VTGLHADDQPDAQERYQVRFDVGLDGARRIGSSAHLIVWCDGLATEPVPTDALPPQACVIDARCGAASAIAQRLLELQAAHGERTMVAVVAAGSPVEAPDGIPVEDHLLAGAVIDALGAVGIDATSPEAAVAAAGYQGLRGAVAHMLTASVGGRAMAAADGAAALTAARERWESTELVVLREFDLTA
jgi:hypothetical protein